MLNANNLVDAKTARAYLAVFVQVVTLTDKGDLQPTDGETG
jgi:hypothetical protein